MSERIFGDNYEVQEELGEGRFGIVYLCQDRKLKRLVALKALRPELTDAKELRRFLGEARTLARLNHENVIQVYDLDDTAPYIVMEYFPGVTLRELNRTERLTPARSVRIMSQVARGLAALHQLEIIHRDVSPNNILVGKDDHAKLLDLGLAKNLGVSSTSTTDGFVGTVKYMSPEVIDNRLATPSSDLFSFGSILYELLAGEHPFEAEHHVSVLYNIVEKHHRALREAVPSLPEDLCDLIDRCLAKEPERRPNDMLEIHTVLQRVSGQGGFEALTSPLRVSASPRRSVRLNNPYLNRMMIKRPSDFYGRRDEVETIYSRLEVSPPQSVSVVGERKIGKSSLLNYVYQRKNREQFLATPDSIVMLYLDLQPLRGGTVEAFVDLLLGLATIELRGRLATEDIVRDLTGIKELAERVQEADLRLILLLDEFEAITNNSNFGIEFFSFLRFLANHFGVGYVTSSARDLQQLCHTEVIRDSPFFNIFSPILLTAFKLEEALELIRRPSESIGHPLAGHEDRITEMAGLFPFFLQLVCSHCMEYGKQHPRAELDWDEIRRRFDQEAKFHYRFIWDGFDEHERSVIRRVAERRKIPDSLRHVEDDLEGRSYLRRLGETRTLFSTSFLRFLETEISRRTPSKWWKRLVP